MCAKHITSNTPNKPHSVLVIEDEPALLRLFARRLEREGYQVATAENGRLGLEKIQSFKPRMIVLDLLMPVMNGIEVLMRLREHAWGARIPVIILTNVYDLSTIVDTMENHSKLIKSMQTHVSKKHQNNIKSYLQGRLKSGQYDFVVKKNCSLSELVERVNTMTTR